jgi:hypothetical protein
VLGSGRLTRLSPCHVFSCDKSRSRKPCEGRKEECLSCLEGVREGESREQWRGRLSVEREIPSTYIRGVNDSSKRRAGVRGEKRKASCVGTSPMILWVLVKSSALHREYGATWDVSCTPVQ